MMLPSLYEQWLKSAPGCWLPLLMSKREQLLDLSQVQALALRTTLYTQRLKLWPARGLVLLPT